MVNGAPHRGRPRMVIVQMEATRANMLAKWQVQSVVVRLESNNQLLWELEDVPAYKLLLEEEQN